MIKKNKIIQILTIYLLLVPFYVFSQANSNYGSECEISFSSSGVDIRKIMSCAEERYGIDTNAMRRANQKSNASTVEVFFSNTAPKSGERITATALPMNFKNTNENLYFTWFLVRDEDDKNDSNLLKKAKKRAMTMVAKGNFEAEIFGEIVEDYSSTTAKEKISKESAFLAPYGGSDGVGGKIYDFSKCEDGEIEKILGSYYEQDLLTTKQTIHTDCISRCYRHQFGSKEDGENNQFNSGKDLIVDCEHRFAECGSYATGDGKFSLGEKKCWGLDPTTTDTDGDGIPDEADLAGLAQDTFTWNYQKGDRVGVIVEGTSVVPINEDGNSGKDLSGKVTSFHKIMWATLDTCTSEDFDHMKNDWCDKDDEIGFSYFATVPVEKTGEQNLETSLFFTPENPQFFDKDEEKEYSSMISVNAVLENESVDINYVHFEWKIYKCDKNDLENCHKTGIDLTAGCGDTEDKNQLKECAKEHIDSDSFSQGIGLKQIDFRPKRKIMTEADDKVYFKVFLKTKRFKTDTKFAISSVLIPISKNNFGIKLYKTSLQESGKYGFKEKDEICKEGIYRDICPVYPGQVVAAKVYSQENLGSEVSFNWKIGNKAMNPPGSCGLYENGCGLREVVYFPVTGDDLDVNDVSLLIKRNRKSDLSAGRVFSINSPMAIILSGDSKIAWPAIIQDSSKAENVFQTLPGSKVKFKAEIVPDYLSAKGDNPDVLLRWYLDGNEIDETFIANNPKLEIIWDKDKKEEIEYKMLGSTGGISNLSVELEKGFSFDEKYALKSNWNILERKNLLNRSSVSVKIIYPGDESFNENQAGIKGFLASTVKNAPEYVVSVMRMAVLFVIFWSVLFGFSYGISTRK